MVADGIHILLGVALFALLSRTDRVEAYLVVILAAGFPDLDRYLFSPLVYGGYLSGPLWTHRGITHSVAALVLFVGAAHLLGHWRPAAIGYGSHLVADLLTGGIRLAAPLWIRPYGLYYDWMLGNVVAGTFATLVVLAELVGRSRGGERSAGVGDRVGTVVRPVGRRTATAAVDTGNRLTAVAVGAGERVVTAATGAGERVVAAAADGIEWLRSRWG